MVILMKMEIMSEEMFEGFNGESKQIVVSTWYCLGLRWIDVARKSESYKRDHMLLDQERLYSELLPKWILNYSIKDFEIFKIANIFTSFLVTKI